MLISTHFQSQKQFFIMLLLSISCKFGTYNGLLLQLKWTMLECPTIRLLQCIVRCKWSINTFYAGHGSMLWPGMIRFMFLSLLWFFLVFVHFDCLFIFIGQMLFLSWVEACFKVNGVVDQWGVVLGGFIWIQRYVWCVHSLAIVLYRHDAEVLE